MENRTSNTLFSTGLQTESIYFYEELDLQSNDLESLNFYVVEAWFCS